MLANGLASCDSDAAQEALTRLAQAVTERGLTEKAGWSALSLATMSQALAKGTGESVHAALAHLAQAFTERPLTREAGWNAQVLAMMGHGLGRCRSEVTVPAMTCLAQALNSRDLGVEQGWTAASLAMITTGLGSGEGPAVQTALTRLARALLRQGALTAARGWSAQHLAMMINGLVRGEGAGVQDALCSLAQAVAARDLTQEQGLSAGTLSLLALGLARCEGYAAKEALTSVALALPGEQQLSVPSGWGSLSLAMMTFGLGKGDGKVVVAALGRLAQAFLEQHPTAGHDWSIRHRAMMASGLARARGPCIREALLQLARTVSLQDLAMAQQDGYVQNLAMMIAGLARGEEADVQEALAHLASLVSQLPPTCVQAWSSADLALMTETLGRTLPGLALFGHCTQALADRAGQDPGALAAALAGLCRHVLALPQLEACARLLEALDKEDWTPGDQRTEDEMLCNRTLLHFASLQQEPVDRRLTDFLARSWQRSLSSQRDRDTQDRAGDTDASRWQRGWAQDYWQPSSTARCVEPSSPDWVRAAVSSSHRHVFDQLKAALPGHQLELEVRVNQFPVDIMIDGRVCVEVDGPEHFVLALAAGDGQAGSRFTRARRTRDLFVDHMLRRYGYQIVRIAGVWGRTAVRRFVSEVRALADRADPAP